MCRLSTAGDVGVTVLVTEAFEPLVTAPGVSMDGGARLHGLVDKVVQAELGGIIYPASTDPSDARPNHFSRHHNRETQMALEGNCTDSVLPAGHHPSSLKSHPPSLTPPPQHHP